MIQSASILRVFDANLQWNYIHVELWLWVGCGIEILDNHGKASFVRFHESLDGTNDGGVSEKVN